MTLTAFHWPQLLGHLSCGVRIWGYSVLVAVVGAGALALLLLLLLVVSDEGGGESCKVGGEVVVSAAAAPADFLSALGLVGALDLVVLEEAEEAAAAAAAAVVLGLGLGLKPGKALPWTSWPFRTIGGSFAQYCAVGSGGGRAVMPILGCLRRGRLQVWQISTSAGKGASLVGLEAAEEEEEEFTPNAEVVPFSVGGWLGWLSFGFSEGRLASLEAVVVVQSSAETRPSRIL